MEISYLTHFLITLAAGLAGLGFALTPVLERLFTNGEVQRDVRELLAGMRARLASQKPDLESEWAPHLVARPLHPLDARPENADARKSAVLAASRPRAKTASGWTEGWGRN